MTEHVNQYNSVNTSVRVVAYRDKCSFGQICQNIAILYGIFYIKLIKNCPCEIFTLKRTVSVIRSFRLLTENILISSLASMLPAFPLKIGEISANSLYVNNGISFSIKNHHKLLTGDCFFLKKIGSDFMHFVNVVPYYICSLFVSFRDNASHFIVNV